MKWQQPQYNNATLASVSLCDVIAHRYQGLILHSRGVPEKVGVNKKGVNKNNELITKRFK
jgi:uncharacterized protein YehS (DUF1456 family)